MFLWTKEEFCSGDISKSSDQKEFFVHYQLASIGGEVAKISEFPWAALLHLRSSETNKTDRCGGTLITNKHVITAAHCLGGSASRGDINDLWDDITVVLGEIERGFQARKIFLNFLRRTQY